jgi:hypothetical protein
LIALIIDAHHFSSLGRDKAAVILANNQAIDRKDHFCFEHTRERCGQAAPTTGDCSRSIPKTPAITQKAEAFWRKRVQIDQDRMCFLFTMLDNPPKLPKKLTAKLYFL